MIDGQKKDQNEQEIKQEDEKSTVFIKSEKKIETKKRCPFTLWSHIVH